MLRWEKFCSLAHLRFNWFYSFQSCFQKERFGNSLKLKSAIGSRFRLRGNTMATMTTPIPTDQKIIPGGSFLITDPTPADCFFPEDFTDEQKQIAETTANFAVNEIMPVTEQIEAKDFAVTKRLLKEAAELGLTAIDIPEEYGGLELDKIILGDCTAENIAKQASFSVTFSAHVGDWDAAAGVVRHARNRRRSICRGSLRGRSSRRMPCRSRPAAPGCGECEDEGGALSRRKDVHAERREDVEISNAGFADPVVTVVAKCAIPDGPDAGKGGQLTAFLIEPRHAGLRGGQGGAQAGDSLWAARRVR